MDNNYSFKIGSYTQSDEITPYYFYNGIIKELSIWSKQLTQEEIKKYSLEGIKGNEIALEGYWKINEGSGTTVYDYSKNGNNGTIIGNQNWQTNI